MLSGERQAAGGREEGRGVSKGRARVAAGRVRRWAAIALGAAALLGAARARAEIAYDLLPSVKLGWTNNAAAAPPWANPKSDEFTILDAVARAHVLSAHGAHQLGFRIADTFYWHGRGPAALTLELAELSDMILNPRWRLRLLSGATYGRTSAPSSADINATVPSVLPARANPYVAAAVSGESVYETSLRSRFIQGLRASGVHYLRDTALVVIPGAAPPVDYSYVFGGTLRLEHDVGRSLLLLQGDLADSYAPGRAAAGLTDQVLLPTILAGWGRDLGYSWSTELRGGALGVYDFKGTKVIAPAGIATLSYRRVAWFVNLAVSQLSVPNIFIAAATINDQVMARLALPLNRSERYYVLGYGGYTYARLADIQGTHRGYDLRIGGVSLTARTEHLPLWASLDYMFSSQLGNTSEGGTIPDLNRMAVMVTVGYAYSTDHEAPPLFHGLLPAVLPMRRDQTEEEQSGSKLDPASAGALPGGPQKPPEFDRSGDINDVTR